MPGPVLHDAVTLLHFGVVGRLDVLKSRHSFLPPPFWTDAVRSEVEAGARLSKPGCAAVLDADWLGEPIVPSSSDLRKVFQLLVGLNDGRRPPTAHGGEAEGIYMAEKLGGTFITDDNAAYDFAYRRLGPGRVKDAVQVLRESVAMEELDAQEALEIADQIRVAGRDLRRVHPDPLPATYLSE